MSQQTQPPSPGTVCGDGTLRRRLVERFVAANHEELAALLWSFTWFFCVLSAYYLVRPVRETFATVVGSVDRLFLGTFVTMLIAAPIYAAVVDRFDRRKFVPIVYRFFSACLMAFGFTLFFFIDAPEAATISQRAAQAPQLDDSTVEPDELAAETGKQPTQQKPIRALDVRFIVGICFFVWVSVFGLFVVSIFWSVLADVFSSEQGKRLFGFIAAGGSIGGIASSSFLSSFGDQLPTGLLLLLPIFLLESAIFCFRQLEKTAVVRQDRLRDRSQPKVQTGIWSGIVSIGKSPYLLGICLFLLLGKWCATTIYMELIDVVKNEVPNLERRTQLFAQENLATQILTLLFQAVLTRQILKWINLPATLAILPAVVMVGFSLISIQSSLWLMFVLQVIQRSGAYGVVVPAQEVLYTVVSEDEKYKSKNFIDTAVYRGGDAASASLHKALIGIFAQPTVASLMVPVAGVWATLGWFIGRSQVQRAQQCVTFPSE